MPPVVIFPYWNFLAMILIALLTTGFAVYLPMKKVNQAQIASVLKQGA